MSERRNYGRLDKEVLEIPDLIEIQTKSYSDFLQLDVPPEERKFQGLQEAFMEIFPSQPSAEGKACLVFNSYEIGEPKKDLVQCLKEGLTYQAALNVQFTFHPANGKGTVTSEKIYMGDVPLMTDRGSFVINGAERVIVSQLHKSPGVSFERSKHASGKLLSSYKIIADHGAWLEVQFDQNDKILIYLDRKRRRRKFVISTFLRAFGYDNNEEMLDAVYYLEEYTLNELMKLEDTSKVYLASDVVIAGNKVLTQGLQACNDLILDELKANGVKKLRVVRVDQVVEEMNVEQLEKLLSMPSDALKSKLEKERWRTGNALYLVSRVHRTEDGKDVTIKDLYDKCDSLPSGMKSSSTKLFDRNAKVTVDALKKLCDVLKEIEADRKAASEREKSYDLSQVYGVSVRLLREGNIGASFINCLQGDTIMSTEDAQKEIYRRMRPTDPPTAANAKQLFRRMFEDPHRYNLGLVGRFKMNQRLQLNWGSRVGVLTKEDIARSTSLLMQLHSGQGRGDDIDHLSRRRIRTVGELLTKQCMVGLTRTHGLMKEKLNSGSDDMTIAKLVNTKALSGVIRDFFGRNQLSQFMDQTNCLAELTNKRRLSALGPGGLTRERAGFEVRDVHSSHYGRICPIETPEGPNIGLISSLALYGKINEYGFIESPYRRVVDHKVTDVVDYLTADEEEAFVIAQANAPYDEEGHFKNENVLCRLGGDFGEKKREEVQYIDVSPKQMISAAAGLIPFLEHDDANRALMGSNMQRQAVPLLRAERPLVGTGLEEVIARDSRATVNAREDGIVFSSDATRIVVTRDGKSPQETDYPESVQEYNLYKFLRTNASTLFNQRPIVKRGDKVKKGQAIADGASTDNGELALGRNVLVAFMPWHGYNFEDAIIISERLVAEDVYTSIHMSMEDIQARDTKLGAEEITRDIPNESEERLRNLDTEGVIRIGAEVGPNDILVGKITPKNEPDLAPEERLMKAIFGEKASDVKNSSLVVPGGCSGIVMDVIVERRADSSKPKATKTDIKSRVRAVEEEYRAKQADLQSQLVDKLSAELLGKKLPFAITRLVAGEPENIIPADRKIIKSMLNRLAQSCEEYGYEGAGDSKSDDIKRVIDEIIKLFRGRLRDNDQCKKEALEKAQQNDPEEQGQVKAVKVYIASKRRISVGDKMAGRHGNKGIVAKIVPVEDMPFMADGTPIDIILNPLGVPSRMNIGQVFETHIGYAAKILGITVASPVFDGVPEEQIWKMLGQAKKKKVDEFGWTLKEDGTVVDSEGNDKTDYFVDTDGKTRLFDGMTGAPFAQRVTVGQIYMLKLDHLVANKIHARAVGPYSLVTQQPLGGKAQHGGQRFGEMEVWALEAYGAAYTLQEMLTVKSDDTKGRTRIYNSIMDGDNSLQAGTPESFNVLMKEMQSLCLDVRVESSKGKQA